MIEAPLIILVQGLNDKYRLTFSDTNISGYIILFTVTDTERQKVFMRSTATIVNPFDLTINAGVAEIDLSRADTNIPLGQYLYRVTYTTDGDTYSVVNNGELTVIK
jgi:hypothetical protein